MPKEPTKQSQAIRDEITSISPLNTILVMLSSLTGVTNSCCWVVFRLW